MRVRMRKSAAVGFLVLLTPTVNARALQEGRTSKSDDRLVNGKIIYIAPMPDNLDQWITQDLKAWGKYHVTVNPEGADLVMRAHVPERDTRFRMRNGIPQPAKEPKTPPAPSVDVVDWVTSRVVWGADILNKKSKRDEQEPAPASHVEILARGLGTDQLGMKIAREFRAYVEQQESGGKR